MSTYSGHFVLSAIRLEISAALNPSVVSNVTAAALTAHQRLTQTICPEITGWLNLKSSLRRWEACKVFCIRCVRVRSVICVTSYEHLCRCWHICVLPVNSKTNYLRSCMVKIKEQWRLKNSAGRHFLHCVKMLFLHFCLTCASAVKCNIAASVQLHQRLCMLH